MKTVFTFLFLAISAVCFSQNSIQYNASANYGNSPAVSGTYQIMTTQPKAEEVFTTNLLYFIEANRDDIKTITKQVGEYTYVKILAKTYISKSDYIRLSDEIIAVDYNEIFPQIELDTKTKE